MRTLLFGVLVVFASGVIAEPACADHRSRDDGSEGFPRRPSAFPRSAGNWTLPFRAERFQRQQPLFSAAYTHASYPITFHGYYGHPRFYGVGLTVEGRYGNFSFGFGR